MTESGLHQSVDLNISKTFMIQSPVVRRNYKYWLTERWQMEADRRQQKQLTTRARGLKKCVTFLINFIPPTVGSLYSYKTSLTGNSRCTVQQPPYTSALLFNSSKTFKNFLSINSKLSKHESAVSFLMGRAYLVPQLLNMLLYVWGTLGAFRSNPTFQNPEF